MAEISPCKRSSSTTWALSPKPTDPVKTDSIIAFSKSCGTFAPWPTWHSLNSPHVPIWHFWVFLTHPCYVWNRWELQDRLQLEALSLLRAQPGFSIHLNQAKLKRICKTSARHLPNTLGVWYVMIYKQKGIGLEYFPEDSWNMKRNQRKKTNETWWNKGGLLIQEYLGSRDRPSAQCPWLT